MPLVTVAGCASTPAPKSVQLGTVAIPRSDLLIALALAIAQNAPKTNERMLVSVVRRH
jgi:hypothetical protein